MGVQCSTTGCTTVAAEYSSQELTIRPKFQACWQDIQDCSSGQTCNSWNVLAHKDEAPIGTESFDYQALPSHHHFAILHGSPGRPVASWRTRYSLGSELGSGQTATVFKALALAQKGSSDACRPKRSALSGAEHAEAASGGRQVALKRFNQRGTLMFKNELKALVTCGVHPHIIRLLESFEGGVHEDVMVLEYCNGGDIYELYASSNGCCMLETFVAQIMRQVVLALRHLVECGVEHRDVKPENLLLYGVSDASRNQQAPLIKLADFGWAAVVEQPGPPPAIPPEGVGSLWYAPPELNPPVKGAEIVADELQGGKSDMWSVGVITYLLLTGHSPFHLALSITDVWKREEEVMRLAAFGSVNTDTKVWNTELSHSARDFILALIKPDPARRLSPAHGLNHPFLATSSSHFLQGGEFRFFSTAGMQDPLLRWNTLDSFQRLCWLAIARAFTEPELMELQSVKDFVRQDGGTTSGYIERLAAQLVSVASFSALTSQAGWSDVLYLAFLYLDVDCDGQLSADDLSVHLPGGYRVREVAQACISKWRSRNQVLSMRAANFLTQSDFREAVSSAMAPATFPQTAETSPRIVPVQESQETLQERMDAIEEACRKMADEGFQELFDPSLEGL
ncbi:unnamed protein product [Cladocopium goreaui]|uniref:Calcium-dependent protein kinase 28 n=1 Tax=Cladocopium goreaui TaxID=2562237 RepID=A0A9P1G7S9_9DINO|nr:unnamed protein product [Cladocopium goreaui]